MTDYSTHIDTDSMADLELYLAAGRTVIAAEWAAAVTAGDEQRAAALSDLWAHTHQAYVLIKPLNDKDKD